MANELIVEILPLVRTLNFRYKSIEKGTIS